MLDEMLEDPEAGRIALRYLADKVAPFAASPLTGDSDAARDLNIESTLAEIRRLLAQAEIPDSLKSRLRYLADNAIEFSRSVGLAVDKPDSIRAYVYLFVPIEEQADFTRWEIRRVQEENQFTQLPELGTLEMIDKHLTMNQNVYMEIKAMALAGGDVSQAELIAFERAILAQIAKARPIVRNFNV